MPDDILTGCAILIVEDEYFIADLLRRDLVQAGATVVGPVSSPGRAIQLIERTPHLDGAILDVNLMGEMVFPVADRLRQLRVPFLFVTGYDLSEIPARFADVPRHEKPGAFGTLIRSLASMISAGS